MEQGPTTTASLRSSPLIIDSTDFRDVETKSATSVPNGKSSINTAGDTNGWVAFIFKLSVLFITPSSLHKPHAYKAVTL
jgi:hypothetical protein